MNRRLLKEFMEKAARAETIEAARAYADSALSILSEAETKVVVLTYVPGGKKIEAIKCLRNHFDSAALGLKEAKDIVETCPYTFKALPSEDAHRLEKSLQNLGCLVSVA